MQRTAIDLVSFAAPAATAAVTELLDGFEWSVRTSPAASWLQATSASAHPLILLLGDEPCSADRIGNAVRQRRGALLGVFAGRAASWESDVVWHCTDFVHWPCSRDELHCRLRRIAGGAGDDHARTTLADDLASLIGATPSFLRASRYCDSCRTATTAPWAENTCVARMCARLRPRTSISRTPSRRSSSAKTSCSVSMSFPYRYRRYANANAMATWPCSPSISCNTSAANTAVQNGSIQTRSHGSRAKAGLATYASCRTRFTAAFCSPTAM